MIDIIMDSVIDSLKLIPFLFLTYLFMEALEHGGDGAKEVLTYLKQFK